MYIVITLHKENEIACTIINCMKVQNVLSNTQIKI